MKRKGNEQGYAMILVLMLIVVITISSAVFMRASISNAKQEQIVDGNNLSVVAAETGVDYYKTAIVNEFNNEKYNLMVLAQDEINNLVNSLEYKEKSNNDIWVESKLEDIRQKLIIELESHYDEVMGSFLVEKTIDITVKFASKGAINADKIADGVIVAGIVTGHSGTYTKDLNFNIKFIVPELILDETGGGSGGGNVAFDNLYPNPAPTGLPNCTDNKSEICIGNNNTSLQNKNHSTIYFQNGFSKENGNLEFNTNQTELYVNSHFIVHNANGMNLAGSSLLVNGEYKVNQNSNNMNQSLIKVNGPFTVGQNMGNINDSTIIVNGSFKVGQNMQNATGTKICVNGSFTVDGNMKLERSEIYVIGSFTVEKEIEMSSSSKIYIYNPAENISSKYAGKVILLDSDAIVREKCGFGGTSSSPPLVSLDWDDNHEINVEY